jgi:hypothetical protein
MLSLILVAYLQVESCCTVPTVLAGYIGPACRDEVSIDIMAHLYAENMKSNEEIARKMVTKTHQCGRLNSFLFPLFIVYRGEQVWGPDGLAEVVGLAPNSSMPPLAYAIMAVPGKET